MSSPIGAKRVFHPLDAARGVAALVVVVFHLPVTTRGPGFGSGDLAVDFFFALSGFVLAHAYRAKLLSGAMSVREFLAVRLVRLYPLYIFSLGVLLVMLGILLAFGKPDPWSPMALLGKLPTALLMLPSPSASADGYLYPFNIAAWSIFFEFAVNWGFALYCRPLQKNAIRRAVIAVSGALLAAQLVIQKELGGTSWDLLASGVPRVCFSFFLGMQLYDWHNLLAQRRTALRPLWGVIALAVLLACLAAPSSVTLKLSAIFLVFPALILVLAMTDLPPGRAGDALRQLGVASYAVYMMHGPVLFAALPLLAALSAAQAPSMGWALPVLATVIAVSWASDRWFDRPVRKRLMAMVRERKTAGTASNIFKKSR